MCFDWLLVKIRQTSAIVLKKSQIDKQSFVFIFKGGLAGDVEIRLAIDLVRELPSRTFGEVWHNSSLFDLPSDGIPKTEPPFIFNHAKENPVNTTLTPQPDINEIQAFLLDLQQRICAALTKIDGLGTFQEESWRREEGGGGLSCVLKNGAVFESAYN